MAQPQDGSGQSLRNGDQEEERMVGSNEDAKEP